MQVVLDDDDDDEDVEEEDDDDVDDEWSQVSCRLISYQVDIVRFWWNSRKLLFQDSYFQPWNGETFLLLTPFCCDQGESLIYFMFQTVLVLTQFDVIQQEKEY